MAKSTDLDIDYVAKLARLELTDQEKEKFTAQLGDILAYFTKLSEVDTKKVEPTAHANPIFDVLRDDVTKEPFAQTEALANAPECSEDQVVVPRVID
jgi:aspartyl-tRNA(Asn)/glutamyl-tRNA(Gln) amidotransferase subunit C